MPLIHVETNQTPDEAMRRELATKLSATAARLLGKPEAYVMVVLRAGSEMLMAGRAGPAAFVDVRSIGEISASKAKALSGELCKLLGQQLAIDEDRIYLGFTSVPAAMWGHDGDTFG